MEIEEKFDVKIEASWKQHLDAEFAEPYFRNLIAFVKSEYRTEIIYPEGKNIFAAFDHCPWDRLKVVIIGQDPYHGPGQANGLCFSVKNGVPMPPSLKNIFKEINSDLNIPLSDSGDLSRWAEQGVMLLNATLTVRARQAGSHQKKGWEEFTDAVIRLISDKKENVAFLLWGAFAKSKSELIDNSKHLILQSAHPSPFSAERGFYGNKHFSRANDFLRSKEITPINW